MKNLYLLPTDKPSRLHFYDFDGVRFSKKYLNWKRGSHMYIISEDEIKDGDWCIPFINGVIDTITDQQEIYKVKNGDFYFEDKKIILTTDQDLIKDGVQAIDDEFLEWFVNNPSCEYVDLIGLRKEKGYEFLAYEIIIPKENPKTNLERLPFPESVEEIVKYYKNIPLTEETKQDDIEEDKLKIMLREATKQTTCAFERMGFILGAKWQAKRMYSEEEVKIIIFQMESYYMKGHHLHIEEWFKQFKKKNYE